MSGKLAPSKSTIYVGNLPFSLTNNDLHKIFEKYGKVVKVTIVKDKISHVSKGVAFILFLERESAWKAVRALNKTEMFGRTLKCSIAKDNGRATEFIRRKEYTDKSTCYECGEEGHLSYKCPKNLLGEREKPKKKTKKDKEREREEAYEKFHNTGEESDSDQGEDPKEDSLSAAIQFQQEKMAAEYQAAVASGSFPLESDEPKKKRFKKDGYFSDEEEFGDD